MADGFRLGIKLEAGFHSKFLKNVKEEINTLLLSKGVAAVKQIEVRLQQSVVVRITSSPEYIAITQSEFRGEIGLPDAASRMDAVIQKWAQGITVTLEGARGAGALGLIKIGILESGYDDVLSLPAAEFSYSGRKGQKTLEWLRWLLMEGGQVIVSNYEYRADSKQGRSRTGLGIMVKRRGGWKIPAQFAGIEGDNFATRALEGIQGDIDIIVRQELTKAF